MERGFDLPEFLLEPDWCLTDEKTGRRRRVEIEVSFPAWPWPESASREVSESRSRATKRRNEGCVDVGGSEEQVLSHVLSSIRVIVGCHHGRRVWV